MGMGSGEPMTTAAKAAGLLQAAVRLEALSFKLDRQLVWDAHDEQAFRCAQEMVSDRAQEDSVALSSGSTYRLSDVAALQARIVDLEIKLDTALDGWARALGYVARGCYLDNPYRPGETEEIVSPSSDDT